VNNNNSNVQANEDHAININQPQVKYTKAYKNPTLLKRNTIKFDRDAVNQSLYFISFEYDSLLDFNLSIYFNATKIPNVNSLTQPHFTVGRNFANNTIQLICQRGEARKYSDQFLFVDVDFFIQNKIPLNDSFDVIIEMASYSAPNKIESKLATYLNISEEVINAERRTIHKIKVIKQEIFIEGKWLIMHDVFGLPGESASFECEICCTNKRNTVFLPCKHSYTCSNCSHSLRMRNNPCPICRNAITDFLIIENQENENANINI